MIEKFEPSVPNIPKKPPRKTFAQVRFERSARAVSKGSVGMTDVKEKRAEEDETQKEIAALRKDIARQSTLRESEERGAITKAMGREARREFTDDELREALQQAVQRRKIPNELIMAIALEFARDAANTGTESPMAAELRALVEGDAGYRFQLEVIMSALAAAMGEKLVKLKAIDQSRREALKNGGLFRRIKQAIQGDYALRTELENRFSVLAAQVEELEKIKSDLERRIKLLEEEERTEREKTRKAQEDALAKLRVETDKVIAFATTERDEAKRAKDEAIAQATTEAEAITGNAETEAKEIIARAQAEREAIISDSKLKQEEIDRLVIRLEELKQTERELSQSHEGATAELTKLKKIKEMIGLELEKSKEMDMTSIAYRIGRVFSRIKSILADPYQVQTKETTGIPQTIEELKAFEKKTLEYIDQLLKAGADKGWVAEGLAGLDSERAWAMRDRLIGEDADKGWVAEGLAGNFLTFVWRLIKRRDLGKQ